jgi:hypothetical protein
MSIDVRIKNKRDTDANWISKNPVLLDGEIVIVKDGNGNSRMKIGDGVSTYTQLPYKVLDTITLPVYENYTLTSSNIKNVILSTGGITITVPSIEVNASFIIKSIANDDTLTTIRPSGVTIENTFDDIILHGGELIEIIQYSDTGYAIISEKRITNTYTLMQLNLEDTVSITNEKE